MDLDAVRDAVCKDFVERLAPFAEMEADELGAAVACSLLCYAGENVGVKEDVIGKVMSWASGIQMQVATLQFFLAGATEITVEDGELAFRMPDGNPEELMRQLVRSGIAKPQST